MHEKLAHEAECEAAAFSRVVRATNDWWDVTVKMRTLSHDLFRRVLDDPNLALSPEMALQGLDGVYKHLDAVRDILKSRMS